MNAHRHPRTTLTVTAVLAATTLTASGPAPKPEAAPPVAATVERAYSQMEASRSYRRPAPRSRSLAIPVHRSPVPPPPPPAWVLPLTTYQLTSCYAYRWGTMHYGIDMAAPTGTPIRTVGAGVVTQAGWQYAGYGITVTVDHGGGWWTLYAHASKVLVRPGQQVAAGQVVAAVGSTGFSTGPHLHFSVLRGSFGRWTNPRPWLTQRGVNIGGC